MDEAIKRLASLKGAKFGVSCSGLEEKWMIDGRAVNITRSPIDWKKATSPMYTERTKLTSNEKRKYGIYRKLRAMDIKENQKK